MRWLHPLVCFALLPLFIAAVPATPNTQKPTTQKSDESAAAQHVLTKKLGELKLSQVTLADAIDYLRDVTGANIHVNWRAMELLNVTRQTPVSLRLNNVSARRALRALLDETGAGQLLTWYVEEGVVEITTRELADSQVITRVYPVEDIIAEIPNFAGPSFNLQNQTGQTSGGGGGGGSSQSLFGGDTSTPEQAPSKDQRADTLVQTITQTVRPEAWRDNGGTASIRYFHGHLIVTAPRSIHEAISGSR